MMDSLSDYFTKEASRAQDEIFKIIAWSRSR